MIFIVLESVIEVVVGYDVVGECYCVLSFVRTCGDESTCDDGEYEEDES